MNGSSGKPLHFENMQFSDVTFEVQGKQLKAHKCVLSCKNDYFRALFSSGLRESSQDGSIAIREMSYEAFYRVIEHIYLDKLRFDFGKELDIVNDVLKLADMYDLEEIKVGLNVAFEQHFSEKNFPVQQAFIDNFVALFPKLATIPFFKKALVSTMITVWNDIPNRDSFIDRLMEFPHIAKSFMKNIMYPKNVRNLREFIVNAKDLKNEKEVDAFIASKLWKNVGESRKFIDSQGWPEYPE